MWIPELLPKVCDFRRVPCPLPVPVYFPVNYNTYLVRCVQVSESERVGGWVSQWEWMSKWGHFLATLWTVVHLPPLSMEFSRQGYWNGLPCPPPGDLPHPEIEPVSLMCPASASRFFTTCATLEALCNWYAGVIRISCLHWPKRTTL